MHTNFDIRTRDFGSGDEAGLHLKGRGYFQSPFFQTLPSLNCLVDFKNVCSKGCRLVFCCAPPCPNIKILPWRGPVLKIIHFVSIVFSFSKTGVKGICESQISKLGLKSKPIHPSEHFNKRIVKSTSV